MRQVDDFVRRQGPAFIAHVLRRVSDAIVAGTTEWYPRVGVTAPPRTASTLLLLDERGLSSVTRIARELVQSHQLVNTWVKQLAAHGFVQVRPDRDDARKRMVSLTPKGVDEARRMRGALKALEDVANQLALETGVNLFEAVCAFDDACRRVPIAVRLTAREDLIDETTLGNAGTRTDR